MKRRDHAFLAALFAAAIAGCSGSGPETEETGTVAQSFFGFGFGFGHYAPGQNLAIEDTLRFTPLQPGADEHHGRALFGVTADLLDSDPTEALFEGVSGAAQGPIVSNGRTCFTCHRGIQEDFGLPAPPLSQSIPTTDPLFTGIDADAQGDPRAAGILEDHALIKYRPNRFNPQRSQGDPFREVFFWRKSPALVNVAFSHGFLMDGRARHLFETSRGAVFSHTQSGDERFDDLFALSDGHDLEAFQKSLFSEPILEALLDPSDPAHETLANNPFATVQVSTWSEVKGRFIFATRCMSCHNMPNVFANLGNVTELGSDGLDAHFPVHGPGVGRTFNIGVAERNEHDLDYRRDNGNGTYDTIVVPLAREDGSTWQLPVTFDIGLAATTGRAVDVGRFKVPQLRNIKNLGPYFHDNSADTLEEVIDYFDSPHYNQSPAGKRYPIHLTQGQKDDLLAFLLLL